MNKCTTNQGRESLQICVSNHYVGEVSNGVFRKSIKGSRHLLKCPPAICLSVESLRQAEQFGAVSIEIEDTESGSVYSSSIEHFKRFSFSVQRGGFELQRGLCLERWELTQPLDIESKAAKSGAGRGMVNGYASKARRILRPVNCFSRGYYENKNHLSSSMPRVWQ